MQHYILQRIKKYRKIKKLTQTELADLLGISRSGYTMLENGDVRMTITTLEEIGFVLKVPFIDLISPLEEHSKNNPTEESKTLRLQIAMNAMQGIIARDKSYKYTPATMVQEAFEIADLMLERNNQ